MRVVEEEQNQGLCREVLILELRGKFKKKRFQKIGRNKFRKPIFTIDGVTFDFDSDLMFKQGRFADDFIPQKDLLVPI